LAGEALPLVATPTLLLVGSADRVVVDLNQRAFEQLQCEKEIKLIEGATHLFEEPGALDQVAELAAQWFMDHMRERRDF
jgi:alpha-beta hydrolase superfamily lysophospholipase